MTRHGLLRKCVAWTTLVAVTASLACGGKTSSTDKGAASPLADKALVQLKDAPPGLDLRVSDGKAGPPAFDRAKLAAAKKLGDAEVNALLARAKPLTTDPSDQQAFALRGKTQPPPRTGQTITGTFPPPPSSLLPPKPSDAGKDLQVLRWMPEGNVPLAPELSVTFSQPMVAVTSQDDAAKTTPVKLTPSVKGRWRWLGTRTILFDPEVRFPQATTYQVEIPAGTKSATGNTLKTATKFSFETPPPSIVASSPGSYSPQHLDVPMFVLFDQKIDPQAVLSKIKVTANGGKAIATRMLDAKELAKDKQLAATIEAAKENEQDGRWLAFRTTQKLPADSSIVVEIPAGTPSAEGPNKTKEPQRFEFRTYPPLSIERSECGYNDICPPGTPFVIQFNNPLDADKFDEAQLSFSPAIPNVHVLQSGSALIVQGQTKARTSYKVVVSKAIADEFEQTLGKDATLSFRVTDAQPTFFGPNGMVVVDPSAKKPTLDFFTTNYEQLKVRLHKVTPADYDAFGFYLQNQWNKDKPPRLPGDKVFDQLIKTTVGPNTLVESSVDLSPAVSKAGLGHAIAIVEPYPWKQPYDPPRLISWVQTTKLAVDAYVDADNLIAFVTELDTGKPAANVALELRPSGVTAKTDDKGLATIALPSARTKGAHHLIARRGDDVAFVAETGWYNEYGSWTKQTRSKNLAWYVIDDRKMYKPGEEVSLKGWLRTIDYGKHGDVGPLQGGVAHVAYRVTDSQGNQIAIGSAPVSGVGGWHTTFTLPKTPNLGYAYVQLSAQGTTQWDGQPEYSHAIQVQEFRRPEFEVSAKASQGPFVIGADGDVTVSAKYYAGGPLPGAPVNWSVSASETTFTPPNRDEFVFGNWRPWWGYHDAYGDRGYGGGYRGGRYGYPGQHKPPKTWSLAAKTDAIGEHTMHLDFLSANPAVPFSVTANASVTDVNRQTWSASAALLVHPSALYVGLRTKKPFVEKGQVFDIDVIGVDVDGKSMPGAKIEVKTVRLDWEYKKGTYSQKEVDPQTCTVTAAKDPVPCTFATNEGGTYQVTATIVDDKGRPNQTKLQFWVTGGDTPRARDVTQERVEIIPDKKEYRPGNTAELLLQAPFYPAEGVVSWRRSGIVKTERISFTGPTKVITVPIEDRMTPNMHVQVDLVGMAPRLDDKGDPDPKLPKRPAYAVGTIDLPVPPKHRTLAVRVTPAAPKLGPGETTKLAVEVLDAVGKPVADAETAVIVVDEAILSLTGYQFPNPVDSFYPQRGADARDAYLRAYVKLAKPDIAMLEDNLDRNGAPGGGAGYADGMVAEASVAAGAPPPPAPPASVTAKPAPKSPAMDLQKKSENLSGRTQRAEQKPQQQPPQPGAPIAIRSNFNPLAAFSPAVRTDAQGRATVDVKVPDNLTRYRIVAIAVAGDKLYGKGESALTARLPLMVRPSPPRFLNFGDTFKLPVVVQNQTDAPMTVKLAARTANLALTDGAGREVTVPPNDRVEVQFPAAAEMAGTARFQVVGAAAGNAADAAELALPVWTPATTEAFATYGVIDQGAVIQPVQLPGKVVLQFGGLEVTTASTNLQALTDAMIYLVKYPYECAEQRASRILAIASLKDVLAAFKTKDLPSPAAMADSIKVDLERLSQMQNGDGGFAFWERGRPSEPYLTVHVANALVRAQKKGFAVPANMIAAARSYLTNIERHYPHYYGPEIRRTISAYALYVRKLMGDVDVAKAQQLIRDAGGVEKINMEANAWLLGTLAGQTAAATERKAIVRHAMNKVSETAGAANFTVGYADGAHLLLASDRRVDAVMLESLIQEQKNLDLIPKLVTGLLAHRKAGRWLNTQENTFALSALDLYFQTYEKVTPNFVARVWLGDDYAGDRAFRGRTTDYFTIPIPMKDVAEHDKQALTIQKDGAGRLYYRVGMTYAPASLKLDPADYGFVVLREYTAVDDPKDVVKQPDGTWKVKAGARVKVTVKMINENRRYHVALVDPMPAGFEAMNPALAVTGPIPLDPSEQKTKGAYWWWYGPWYEHQNMRDERIEAFASLLWEGVHTYEYVARATTPGTFVVPPPKAEEMYMPETFGRGASDRVIVE